MGAFGGSVEDGRFYDRWSSEGTLLWCVKNKKNSIYSLVHQTGIHGAPANWGRGAPGSALGTERSRGQEVSVTGEVSV